MPDILALPHAIVTIETGNNEDWVESFKFVVDDGSGNSESMPQFDIRGIQFLMEVRRKITDHEVLLTASTDNLKLSVGSFPNYGFLLLNVSVDEMKGLIASSYVADVVAMESGFVRKCMTITVKVVEGVTRSND